MSMEKEKRKSQGQAGGTAKQVKKEPDVNQMKGDFSTWATRMQNGTFKRATSEEIETAASMLKTYRLQDHAGQEAFVRKFMATKGSKDFQWHKNLTEEVASGKHTEEGVHAKYRTRCGSPTPPLPLPPPPRIPLPIPLYEDSHTSSCNQANNSSTYSYAKVRHPRLPQAEIAGL